MKVFKKILYAVMCAGLLIASLGVQPVYAAGMVVNSDVDTTTTDGFCTLREAITNANSDDQSGSTDCAAGSGADAITFAGDYTITLGSQLPAVTSQITITGNGAANTIIQANAAPNIATYRVFEVTSAGNLTLDSLTVRHGNCDGLCATDSNSGGGIHNFGSLTVTNSVISDNSASTGGGIFNDNTMSVTNSTFSGNSANSYDGGGIFNGGALTMTNSALSGNSATSAGGGISNTGTLTVTNSTFSGNSVVNYGGGIANVGALTVTNSTLSGNSADRGGGISNSDTLTVINSALSGNSSQRGGGIYNEGTLTVTNGTLSGNSAGSNGGGIYNAGTLTVTNSTLSGNSAGSDGGGIYNMMGTLHYSNTIIANSTGEDCAGGSIGTNTNNLVEDNSCSPALSGDPKLAALADNGGPTQTHALLAGSPAIDAGNATVCANAPVNNLDQRGVTRPQGSVCDIGAYEATPANIVVNSNADDTLTNLNDNTTCDLREAITNANDNAATYPDCAAGGEIGADAITFAGDYTITLVDQLPAVTSQMTITGEGAANTIIQASTCNPVTLPGGCTPATYHVFHIGSTGSLTLDSLTVRHGRCNGSCYPAPSDGGGIYNAGTLIVMNSALSGNWAVEGGGILNDGTLTVTNSTLSGNSANYGGGISNYGSSTLTVTDSALSGNSASDTGGGIYNYGTATVTNSTLSGNSATWGGGVHSGSSSTLTVTNSTFSGNSAASQGGGISNGGTLTVTNSTFSGNSAASQGGGIYSADTLTVTNSTLSGNSADRGGGIHNYGALTVTNSALSGNSANRGGGISNEMMGTLTVTNSTFSGNSASNSGGGIYSDTMDGTLTVTNSTLSGNSAGSDGGGIYSDTMMGTLTVTNSTLSGNSASSGGGIYNLFGTLHYSNTIIANSTSGGDCVNNFGSIGTNVNNLVESGGCGTLASDDPNLGPLADNGGPTQTHALQFPSLAIDAGDATVCANAPVNNLDQRGVTRLQGSVCDIGAYELAHPTDIALSNASVAENQSSGTLVGTLSTTDLDVGDTFTYTFACSTPGADDASFQISGSQLQTAASFDYEAKNSYNICIRVTDSGGATFDKNFTIVIENKIDTATFQDVPTNYWAWQWVESIYAAGITGGCGASPLIYCPTSSVTRAQMAVFILRGMYGGSYTPPPVGGSTGFADVPVDHWAAAWIKQLKVEGITGGCDSQNYCPDAPVTRAQMAVFLLRAKYNSAYSPPPVGGSTGFADVPVDHWAAAWIKQLYAESITGGCGVGIYCPDSPASRDQMAVFLQKTFSLPLP